MSLHTVPGAYMQFLSSSEQLTRISQCLFWKKCPKLNKCYIFCLRSEMECNKCYILCLSLYIACIIAYMQFHDLAKSLHVVPWTCKGALKLKDGKWSDIIHKWDDDQNHSFKLFKKECHSLKKKSELMICHSDYFLQTQAQVQVKVGTACPTHPPTNPKQIPKRSGELLYSILKNLKSPRVYKRVLGV